MRSEKEVIERIRIYQENIINMDKNRKKIIQQAILELNWVLGEKSNESRKR